jgi:hypothetical protein
LKLSSATSGQVVRNTNNGSYYRYERIERGKARIWPLELFPNGLLIAKPTPTLVDAAIEVVIVGPWLEGMVVEGSPSQSRRRSYEQELIRLEQLLPVLRQQYDALPKGGKGTSSRGSFANKLKCTTYRITVLKQGLGFAPGTPVQPTSEQGPHAAYAVDDIVQVPSGRLAKILGFSPMGDQMYAQVKTLFHGAAVEAALPCEVLRPGRQARLCTI